MTEGMISPITPTNIPLSMFNQSLHRSWLHSLWAKVTGHCNRLEDLNEELEKSTVESSYFAGTKSVNINRIHGTLGKSDEFDAQFMPTQERSRSRWVDIALQKLRGRDLPPVELIEINGNYYVRDGHHRISVSRAMGQDYIDAEIIHMQLRQNMFR